MRRFIFLILLSLLVISPGASVAQHGGAGGPLAYPPTVVECTCLPEPERAGKEPADGKPHKPRLSPAECSAQGGITEVYSTRSVIRRAAISEQPEPEAAAGANAKRTSGTVRLRVVLCPNGLVAGVVVVKGVSAELNELAIAAAKKLKFTPAVGVKGKPVAQHMTLDYDFKR